MIFRYHFCKPIFMKRLLLLFYVFLGSSFLFAQEFTPPDSVAIRKSKVKTVKIFYTGTGTVNSLTHEYHYNRKGQCIFSSEGSTATYYYSFRYDSLGRCNRWDQRQMNGNLISGNESDFYSDGKLFHMKYYSDKDTVFPNRICTYDTLGNTIDEKHFNGKQFIQTISRVYDANRSTIRICDSTNSLVTIISKGKLIYNASYDSIHHAIEIWNFVYDKDWKLVSSTCRTKDKTILTELTYANDGKIKELITYSLKINGKPATFDQEMEWKKRWDYLTPKFKICGTDDLKLPISDPIPIEEYKHQLKKDKMGNIISDRVISGNEWMNEKPVLFSYKYEYWK